MVYRELCTACEDGGLFVKNVGNHLCMRERTDMSLDEMRIAMAVAIIVLGIILIAVGAYGFYQTVMAGKE